MTETEDDYWDIIDELDPAESAGPDEEDLLEELQVDWCDDSLAYE